MIYFGALFVEIAILFFLSRTMTRSLSGFMSINFLSFLFLPGVIVHEFSHLFMAVILFVPVGEIEFTPRLSSSGLKLGSIEIGKTDPIRRSIISFAPVFVGLLIVIGIFYFFSSNILFFKDKEAYIFAFAIVAIIYSLFAISNTMFSSSNDMEGTAEIVLTLLIIFAISYILGFRISLSFISGVFTKQLIEIIQKSATFLLAPIVIDLLILGIIRIARSRSSGSRSRRF